MGSQPSGRLGRDLDLASVNAATLLSGGLVWGAVGFGLDRWLGLSALFLPIGALLGFVAATYLVVARSAARRD